jgi:hypothetical protein
MQQHRKCSCLNCLVHKTREFPLFNTVSHVMLHNCRPMSISCSASIFPPQHSANNGQLSSCPA